MVKSIDNFAYVCYNEGSLFESVLVSSKGSLKPNHPRSNAGLGTNTSYGGGIHVVFVSSRTASRSLLRPQGPDEMAYRNGYVL